MLAVIALGGGALLRHCPRATAEARRDKARAAARAIAPVAAEHQVVIGYGNGPHAGPGAREGAACESAATEQTGETIGYMMEQELRNLLPFDRPFAVILTTVEVDPGDSAFDDPATFVGPGCPKEDADRLARERGWIFKQDGDEWRRAVASPEPKRTLELRPVKWLLERNTVVMASGGGIPVMYEPGADRRLAEVECVIEKDLASELLARELGADVFVMLTDADAVYLDWGSPAQTAIRRASPASLEPFAFAAGSMGVKVRAACRFAKATGKRAAIGALGDLTRIIAGEAGTTISTRETGIVYAGTPGPGRLP